MNLVTKANALQIINKLDKTLVPKLIFFKKKDFLKDKKKFIKRVKNNFNCDIIIRSSALNEDNKT